MECEVEMRVAPLVLANFKNKNNNKQTQFVRNNSMDKKTKTQANGQSLALSYSANAQNSCNTQNAYERPQYHKYSGNASKDLAWASMFDSNIAKDLKIMGLI